MKDAPPRTFLLPNQEWVVVEAPDWAVLRYATTTGAPYRCTYFEGGVGCSAPAVAACSTDRKGKPLCDEHIGSIRFVDPDSNRVMQWRANPPFTDYLRG